MNTTNLASLIAIENLRTIGITFSMSFDDSSAKIYTYKTIDTSIKIGDSVVVSVGNHYKVVPVVRVDIIADLTVDHIDYKWITQKVDDTLYLQLIEKEKIFAEKLRELEQIALVNTAKTLLSEKLGVNISELEKEIKG